MSTKTPPNRLTYEEHYAVCKFLDSERATVSGLSVSATALLVKKAIGTTVTPSQVRNMIDLVGIEKKDSEEELRYVLTAVATRLNWPWATLVSEGRKIIGDQDTKRLGLVEQSEPLPGTTE